MRVIDEPGAAPSAAIAFTESEIRAAGDAIALRKDQADGLVAVLLARRAALPDAAAHRPAQERPAHERPAHEPAGTRFDLVHLLWYAGALIVIGSMGLFSTLAFEAMGGAALAVTSLIYAAVFVAAGRRLWHRHGLTTPGGLMIAIAVAMVPLAVYGVQDAFGLWGDDPPERYRHLFVWIRSSWLPMEVATIVAGLVAIRFYPFPFITVIIAVALWFMSMDLAPWLLRQDELTWAARRMVSMVFGLVVLAAAWTVDLRRPPERDFAFWLHLFGLLAFWGGLTFASSSSEAAKAGYCLVNVLLLLLSVFLGRRAYALFGTIGVSLYLGHLAGKVFADSLLFPFALSLIGVGIIAAGLMVHRHRRRLSAWMMSRLPDAFKKLRPPHAGAVTLEHA